MPREGALKRRRELEVLARDVDSSDLVGLTLGLVETWCDTRTGVVYNGLNVAAVKDLRHQTGFFSATVDQVVSVLSDALEALKKRNPDVKVVITKSEEHTSELQSLMRISYAVLCFNKKTTTALIFSSCTLIVRTHNTKK